MNLSKRYLLPIAAVAVVATATIGAATVSAATGNQPGSLAQKLAGAFHLDATKVQTVIDQNRDEHHASMQAKMDQRYEDRLTKAVKEGKITDAQKTALIAEQKKLTAELAAGKDMSPTERRDLLKKVKDEATTWAKQNNLDVKWLLPGRAVGMGMHRMMHQAN